MPKPYSVDLRARVIEEVETGASRREAAERYGISPSVVVIWVQRFEGTGSVAAKPSGGSISPLEQHAEFLLGLIANQPDLTLNEMAISGRMIVMTFRTDGNHRYSWTKNKRSLFVNWTRPRTIRRNTIS